MREQVFETWIIIGAGQVFLMFLCSSKENWQHHSGRRRRDAHSCRRGDNRPDQAGEGSSWRLWNPCAGATLKPISSHGPQVVNQCTQTSGLIPSLHALTAAALIMTSCAIMSPLPQVVCETSSLRNSEHSCIAEFKTFLCLLELAADDKGGILIRWLLQLLLSPVYFTL